jgi:hypothetical protein
MSFTPSEQALIEEAARAAARAARQELLQAIPQIVEDALQQERGPVLELLERIALSQVSAAGTYAATLKSELRQARGGETLPARK